MKVLPLPPSYSPADAVRRDQLLAGIADLLRRYQEAARPLIDEVVAIERRYPPRLVVVRDEKKGGGA